MQVDGMIATILRQEPTDRRSCIVAWRQLSDILAQRGNQLDNGSIHKALHALAVLRSRVPETVRRETAEAIARHGRFAPIVALYANDSPAVSTRMLALAQLSEADWLAFLPSTTPAVRAQLAARRDLPPAVKRALASLGSGAVPLPLTRQISTEEVQAVGEPPHEFSQISELVRRIDKYRTDRTVRKPQEKRDSFLFETTSDGTIHWVDGVNRGAVIGLSIAEAALAGEPGTDGVAAGAFRQLAEMINARMVIEGGAADAGEWRFSALPWFDPASGHFRGYRGSARRPFHNEIPYGQSHTSAAGDSIRQLIHELRSPLNAISGFAQIIEGQMFGPVSHGYRQLAGAIIADANNIQTIIDDLDTTAKAGTAEEDRSDAETTDLAVVLTQVECDLAALVTEQRIDLCISRVGGPFFVHTSERTARRMVGRLLTALVDVAGDDKSVIGQLVFDQAHPDLLQLRIVRPAAIRFSAPTELLDPGFSPSGEAPGAAILSLGFSLRLVDSLARAVGGGLEIGHNALTLRLRSANAQAAAPLATTSE